MDILTRVSALLILGKTMKVETLENKIANLKRFTLQSDNSAVPIVDRACFTIRYSAKKECWFAGFGRHADGKVSFEGITPMQAMDKFLENFVFKD